MRRYRTYLDLTGGCMKPPDGRHPWGRSNEKLQAHKEVAGIWRDRRQRAVAQAKNGTELELTWNDKLYCWHSCACPGCARDPGAVACAETADAVAHPEDGNHDGEGVAWHAAWRARRTSYASPVTAAIERSIGDPLRSPHWQTSYLNQMVIVAGWGPSSTTTPSVVTST